MKIKAGMILFTFVSLLFLIFMCGSKKKSDLTKRTSGSTDSLHFTNNNKSQTSSIDLTGKDNDTTNGQNDKKLSKTKPLTHDNMVKIPKGNFTMGSLDGESDESPVHQVTVKEFYMDKTEVTQAEYEKITGKNPSIFNNCPSCPVENVTWDEANDYCQHIGKRLPAEAEWEYAARAGTKTRYYWGDEKNENDSFAWFDANSNSSTQPVGQKKPNKWGLYDMSGNVREWCSDWYEPYTTDNSPYQQAPSFGGARVLRGGSWSLSYKGIRSTLRGRYDPKTRDSDNGFRCVSSK